MGCVQSKDNDATAQETSSRTIAASTHATVNIEAPSALLAPVPQTPALSSSQEPSTTSNAAKSDTLIQIVNEATDGPHVVAGSAPSVGQNTTTASFNPDSSGLSGPTSQGVSVENDGKKPTTLWERAIAKLKASDAQRDVETYVELLRLQASDRSLCGYVFKRGDKIHSCTKFGNAAGSFLCNDCWFISDHTSHKDKKWEECQAVGSFCACGVLDTSNRTYVCQKHAKKAITAPQGPKPLQHQAPTLESCLAICNACESRAKALEKNELAIKIDGKSYNIRSISRAISQVMITIKDVVAPIARLDPHGGAVYACAAIFTVFSVILQEDEQHRFLVWCVADIFPILEKWSYYEVRQKRTGLEDEDLAEPAAKLAASKLTASIVDLYVHTLKYILNMMRIISSRSVSRFFSSIVKSSELWKEHVKQIQGINANCNAQKDECDAEKKFQEQNAGMLDWITTSNAVRQHEKSVESKGIDETYAACGQWFLDQVFAEDFLVSSKWQNGVLWLSGTTGTGKSTLVTRFIEWMRQRSDLQGTSRTIYHYCSRTTTEKNIKVDYLVVLRSLIRQLAWNSESFSVSKAVNKWYNDLKTQRSKDSELSSKECERLLLELLQECVSGICLVVVIDALDECDQPDQLLGVLKSLWTHDKCNIRFVISSRLGHPGDEIRLHFRNQLQILTNANNSKDDMAYYVHESVQSKKPRLLKGEASNSAKQLEEKQLTETRLIDVLTEKAQGMFKWVELRLNLISEPSHPFRVIADLEKHIDQLKASELSPLEALDEAYADIFERNCGQGEESKRRTMAAFHWVLDAFEPLTFDRLAVLVSAGTDGSLDSDFGPDALREHNSNFLVDNHDSEIQFAHASARDFIGRYKEKDSRSFNFASATNHARIAETCLQILLNNKTMHSLAALTIPQVRELSDGSGSFREDTIYRSWNRFANPVAWATTYILNSWPYHCRAAGRQERKNQTLSENMARLLIDPPNGWGEDTDKLFEARAWLESLTRERTQSSSYELLSTPPVCIPNRFSYDLDTSCKKGIATGTGSNHIYNAILPICAFGFTELLKIPDVSKHFNFQAQTQNSRTALHLACQFGETDAIRFLLEPPQVHALLAAKDSDGVMALQTAIFSTNPESVKLLLDHGANIFPETASDEPACESGMKRICGDPPVSQRESKARIETFKLVLDHEQSLRNRLPVSNPFRLSSIWSDKKSGATSPAEVKYGGVSLLVSLSREPYRQSLEYVNVDYPWPIGAAFAMLLRYDVGWASSGDRESLRALEKVANNLTERIDLIAIIIIAVSDMLYSFGNNIRRPVYHCVEGEREYEKVISEVISIYVNIYKQDSNVQLPSWKELLQDHPSTLATFRKIREQTGADGKLSDELRTMWDMNRRNEVEARRWRKCEYCGKKVDQCPWMPRASRVSTIMRNDSNSDKNSPPPLKPRASRKLKAPKSAPYYSPVETNDWWAHIEQEQD